MFIGGTGPRISISFLGIIGRLIIFPPQEALLNQNPHLVQSVLQSAQNRHIHQKIDLDSYLYEMIKLQNFSVSIEEIIRNRIENLKII